MTAARAQLKVASLCYGGVASADHMRSLLRLRSLTAKRNISVVLDLSGGEALASRGRAAALAGFLDGDADWLLFTDGLAAFDADAVLHATTDATSFAWFGSRTLLVSRAAAERLAQTRTRARLGDIRGREALFVAALSSASGDLEAIAASLAQAQANSPPG